MARTLCGVSALRPLSRRSEAFTAFLCNDGDVAEKSHSSRDFAESSSRGAGLDYAALFANLPGLFLILGPGFEIVAATDAFLAATTSVRDEILGKKYFEVFPDNPDDSSATGVANMRASLDRVVETRKPDSMAVQKYALRKRADDGDGFEVRYWSAINSPILDGDGDLQLIVHRVEDVTDFVKFRGEGSVSGSTTLKPKSDMEWIQAEILRRSAELHDSNVDLRAASDAKNVFLSRMSHELRSPLTAILGYSELLKIESDPGGEVEIAAEAINRAGMHLLELIN